MSFPMRMTPDFFTQRVAAPLPPPPPPVLPAQITPPGNGTFSASAAGTAPQKTLDVPLAQMSNDSYDIPGPDGKTHTDSEKALASAGWTRLQSEGDHLVDAQGNHVAIDPKSLENSSTGFRAAIYQGADGKYVVAFAGTDPSELPDISADATQAFGLETTQYNEAMSLARDAEVAFGDGNVITTGHSLGGGLAAAAALSIDSTSVTFNAAGVSNDTMSDLGLNPSAVREQTASSGQVRRYVVENDPLTLAQQGLPSILGISPPDAIGHELRLAAVPGTTPVIGGHGGGGNETTYVVALRDGTPYEPTAPGLVSDTIQNGAEYTFNQIGTVIDAGSRIVVGAKDVISGKAGEISGVFSNEYANGQYIEGTASIAGDVLEGTVDIAGDIASAGFNAAGEGVENATNYAGSVLRDLGQASGLSAPANAVAGVIEGGGQAVGNAATAVGEGAEWTADKVGNAAEWTADTLGNAGQWTANTVVDGVQWTGGKIAEGAQIVGNAAVVAADATVEAVQDGAVWVADTATDVATTVVDGVKTGAGAVVDGVEAGADWVGDRASDVAEGISNAMPWNWGK